MTHCTMYLQTKGEIQLLIKVKGSKVFGITKQLNINGELTYINVTHFPFLGDDDGPAVDKFCLFRFVKNITRFVAGKMLQFNCVVAFQHSFDVNNFVQTMTFRKQY